MNSSNNKPNILFVGAFSDTQDGSFGGQLYACKTLIESELSKKVNFIKLDSTMESIPPKSFMRRLALAFRRMILYFYFLSFKSIDTVFIFTSSGFSFIEKGTMILVAKLFDKRTILSPRSGLIEENIEKSVFFSSFLKFVFFRCDKIMCQSSSWKHYFQELTKLPDRHFKVIPNWIDADPYLKVERKSNTNKKIKVLFLGWVENNKGIFDLLTAVKDNKNLLSDFEFSICGKGSQLSLVKEIVQINHLDDQFIFKGWMSGQDKIQILSESDILILPSHREGLPNALLEGMASGCSVIATSVGAIPEVVEHKKNGILINSQCPSDILKALLDLKSDTLRDRLSSEAKTTIVSNHDIKTKCKDIESLLGREKDALA